MERVKEFLTRYQEMNTNLDLFINEPDSFALKHQKVLTHFYEDYGDTKVFSEILLDLVLSKSNAHGTLLLLDSIRKEAEHTIELVDNCSEDLDADMDIVNGEIELRYVDELKSQIAATCHLGSEFLKISQSFNDSQEILEKMNIHNDEQYWREYDRRLEEHYKAVVALHELYDKHWQSVSEAKKYEKNVAAPIYEMSKSFLFILDKYQHSITENKTRGEEYCLQTKEEQHDAHSVGKIVKQPVENATPYFEMGLISTVYNACVGEQFVEMAEVDFYNNINLMSSIGTLKIRNQEKSRVCYLIHLLSEQLERSCREEWRTGILSMLDIAPLYYKSKYKEAANRYSSKKNKEFAAEMKKIFG